MDINAAFRDLLAAIAARDVDAARDLADSVKTWLDRGGFQPAGYSPEQIRETLNRAADL